MVARSAASSSSALARRDLPDARRSGQRDESRAPRFDDGVERLTQLPKFCGPADQWPAEGHGCDGTDVEAHVLQAPSLDELGLALRAEGRQCGQTGSAGQQLRGRGANEDLAGRRSGLERLCHIDWIRVRHGITSRQDAGHHLADIEARVHGQLDVPP
jgi:hypothetical protein